MAFIRCRQSSREKSYQVVETYREEGKVKQRVLANLGPYPTVGLAIENARRRVARDERRVEHCKHGRTRQWRPLHSKHLLKAEKDLASEAPGVPIEAKLRSGTPPGQRGAMTRPVLSPAQGRSGVSGRVLPDGHPDPRKAAETWDFFGPLWHMQDIAP